MKTIKKWSSFPHFLNSKILWSWKTFGPGARAEGICKHIEKELLEVRAKPDDLSEWVDIILLATDGALRAGSVAQLYGRKCSANTMRTCAAPGRHQALRIKLVST